MIRTLLIFAAATLGALGCKMPADAGCVSDSECYSGRVCVDGQCTGDVPLLDGVDDAGTDAAPDATGYYDIGGNNGTTNNSSMNNGVPNNVTRCLQSVDCADPLICAEDPTAPNGPVCTEPWRCDVNVVNDDPGFCMFDFACDVGDALQLFCDFGDRDRGTCTCLSVDGQAIDFETGNSVCADISQLTDVVNNTCGWRLPRF